MIGKSWRILRRGPIVTASNLHLPGKFECIGRWRLMYQKRVSSGESFSLTTKASALVGSLTSEPGR